jgi:glucan 1,3-beta-glucosidase
MVSVLRLLSRSVFAYDLKSVAYKPIPGANGTAVAAPGANATAVQPGSAFINQAVVALQEASKTHGKSAKPSGSCDVQPYDAPPISDQTFPPFDQTTANVFRYRQQQSVNMGSWYVQSIAPFKFIFKPNAPAGSYTKTG